MLTPLFSERDTSLPAYGGKGVLTAIKNVNTVIAPALIAKHFDVEKDQKKIDAFLCELDGTMGKKMLGANAILGVSVACARAGAAAGVSNASISTDRWKRKRAKGF